MATKGASNRYTNTKGSINNTKNINYSWAKDFNENSLKIHFRNHGKDMGIENEESYKQHAIKFANTIDKKNCESFVDKETGATYKYNKVTNEFEIIKKNGYIATYFKPKDGYNYYKNQKAKHGKKKGGSK